MKGIYFTVEGKKEIEAKIVELSGYNDEPEITQLKIYQEILSSAIILPVEKSWKLSVVAVPEFQKQSLKRLYPNGVIIQPNPK